MKLYLALKLNEKCFLFIKIALPVVKFLFFNIVVKFYVISAFVKSINVLLLNAILQCLKP